jgi:hypothetical protein
VVVDGRQDGRRRLRVLQVFEVVLLIVVVVIVAEAELGLGLELIEQGVNVGCLQNWKKKENILESICKAFAD